MILTQERHSFGWIDGDPAGYSVNDGAAAVSLARTAGRVAIDIETGSAAAASRWQIKAVSVGTSWSAHVLDPATQSAAIIDAIAAASELVFHNASYDVPILIINGLMSRDAISKVVDTLVTARMIWPGVTTSKRLGDVAERVLGDGYLQPKHSLEEAFRELTGRSKSAMWDELDMSSPAYCAYAGWDVIITARVREALPDVLVSTLSAVPMPVGDLAALEAREHRVNRVMLHRSAKGIALDFDALDDVVHELRRDSQRAGEVLLKYDIDPEQSPAKLKSSAVDRLDALGLIAKNWPRLKSGRPSASKTWLSNVNHPIADALGIKTSADRFVEDYTAKVIDLARDGRIHPAVNVLAAVSGRMSYANPPLQQFPAKVRRVLRSETPIVSFDWSSIEPVVIANMAGDEAMLAPYECGDDLYLPIAAAAGCDRPTAKKILLAALYGQGVTSLAQQLGVSVDAARSLNRKVMGSMSAVATTIERVREFGNQYGWVRTLSGRPIPLPRDNRGFKGYKGVNYLVQGSAYDLLAEALVAIDAAGLSDSIFLAVHDEIVVDADAADEVAHIMANPPAGLGDARDKQPLLRVGRSDLGFNWKEK